MLVNVCVYEVMSEFGSAACGALTNDDDEPDVSASSVGSGVDEGVALVGVATNAGLPEDPEDPAATVRNLLDPECMISKTFCCY